MKITINEAQFISGFFEMGRGDSFSHEGLQILFEYFEELEANLGTYIEYDVIAICCDYSEDTPLDIADHYGIDLDDGHPIDPDAVMDAVREYLEQETTVVGCTETTIVYQNF